MKKICILPIVFAIVLLNGCLKDTPAVDFSTVGTIIEILPPNGGLENFDNAGLDFDPGDEIDSEMIVVNIASPKVLTKALTVSLAVNDAARTDYNTSTAGQYLALPDSVYSFPVSSRTIPAGSRLDTFMVYFYPAKIDTTQDYMLPIGIKDAQGEPISGNFNTVYFHADAR
jgi:Domain of unknown function (DUF1735)